MDKKQYIKIDENFHAFVEQAKQLGILHKTKVRNLTVRHEYVLLRVQELKYDEAIHQLSEKFFLSYASIEKIIEGITEKLINTLKPNGLKRNKITGKEALYQRARCA